MRTLPCPKFACLSVLLETSYKKPWYAVSLLTLLSLFRITLAFELNSVETLWQNSCWPYILTLLLIRAQGEFPIVVMALTAEAIIAIIGVLISLPPTILALLVLFGDGKAQASLASGMCYYRSNLCSPRVLTPVRQSSSRGWGISPFRHRDESHCLRLVVPRYSPMRHIWKPRRSMLRCPMNSDLMWVADER